MQPLFTRPETWTGGSYELGLEYGPLESVQVRGVLTRLWSHPSLCGCYLDHTREPGDQPRVSPAEADPDHVLRGIATLPNGAVSSCDSSVLVWEDSTWVYFGTPVGALGYAYPVGAYPFDDGRPLDWRTPLDAWLLDVAASVFEEHPFRLGLVGWLDPVETSAAEVADAGVPDRRWEGYVVPVGGRLTWHPPNEGALFTIR